LVRKFYIVILAVSLIAILTVVLASRSTSKEEPQPEGAWFNLDVREAEKGCVYTAEALVFGPIPAHFSISLPAKNDKFAEDIFDAAVKAIDNVNHWASVYREDSEISVFNRGPAGIQVTVPHDFIEVLATSQKANDLSGGAFDPTVKPMINLYRSTRKAGRLPTAEERAAIMPLIGLKHVIAGPGDVVSKDLADVALDFGGVAKGYGVDKAVEALKAMGVKSGLVEIGGDLRAFGTRPDGSPWHVGITNPLEPKSIYYLVDLPPDEGPADYALVTSGDYEQFYEVAGVRYTHIFEPKTGEPILYRGAGVSVAASDATTADALATAFFVVGRERSLAIAEKTGVGVLWLESTPEKTLAVTMNDRFQKLKPEQKAESK